MISKALMEASTKPILLTLLQEGEDYGYNIIQRVKTLSGGSLEWSDGMLYPVLQKMEKEGVIASHWVPSEGGRYRKYYRITDRGREELERQLTLWRGVIAALGKFCPPLVPAE